MKKRKKGRGPQQDGRESEFLVTEVLKSLNVLFCKVEFLLALIDMSWLMVEPYFSGRQLFIFIYLFLASPHDMWCDTSSPAWDGSIGSMVVALEVALEAQNRNHWTVKGSPPVFVKVLLYF